MTTSIRTHEGRLGVDDRMIIRPFSPSFMPVGILTAAFITATVAAAALKEAFNF